MPKIYDKVSKNFTWKEYFTNQTQYFDKCEQNILVNIKAHSGRLQQFRDFKNHPITIISGFRSIEHNKEVGGRPASFHLYGMAADISYPGISQTYKVDFCYLTSKFNGVIWYPDQLFFHVDIGGRKFHSMFGPG